MNKKILKFFISFVLVFFLVFFLFAFVLAKERKLEVKYPEIFGIKPETIKIELPKYINYVFNFAIVVSGLVIFGALVWGGILYLTSAGQPVKLIEARERILSAFLGIIILLSSYLILTTISPELVTFPLPPLKPIEKKESPLPSPLEKEETSLIALEIPYGQSIENGVWEEKWRKDTENLLKEDEEFLEEEIKVGEETFARISDLNNYLKKLSEDCKCGECQALCTAPANFCAPVGCRGNPCKRVQDKIDEVKKINKRKSKILLDFQKKIDKERKKLEDQLAIFNDVEGEMVSCQEETKSLLSFNEYLTVLDFLKERGWKLKTLTIPNTPSPKGDSLNFYCAVGGTLSDYPYLPEAAIPETPTELELPEPSELGPIKIKCPVEFPLGEIVDELRESAVFLLFKLKKLVLLHENLVFQMEKMREALSECNKSQNCNLNCTCIPNPFYYTLICRVGCSPCFQCIGACLGEPCPRSKIDETLTKIKETEDEIFSIFKEVKPIFPKVASLIKSEKKGEEKSEKKGEENLWNLENVREKIKLCYSSEFEEPTWQLVNCQNAIENYGPGDEVIASCHPRNFFCCTSEDLTFPGETIPRPAELIYPVATEKYQPLPSENNCPKGWKCDPDVKNYNQYENDASQPLKEFLSCMRVVLDNIQKEKNIKETIGRISSISDSRLYTKDCDWMRGPIGPEGCSHAYEIKYKKERVSAHYGGLNCRAEERSYAVDLGDEWNYSYLKEAAEKCQPGAFIKNEGDHIHISISALHNCGAN